jgi:hypothetical protein
MLAVLLGQWADVLGLEGSHKVYLEDASVRYRDRFGILAGNGGGQREDKVVTGE